MVLLDNQHIINDIDYYGETVTVTTVTQDSVSKWGDATESTSDETGVKSMVNELTPEELKAAEGIVDNAEKRFFFKPDQSNITEGNEITHSSELYRIVRVFRHEAGGSDFVQEAWAKKI